MTGWPLARIARTLGIGRSSAYRERGPRASHYHRREDARVYQQLRSVLRERGSYGYRRAQVLVNRAFGTRYNRKRIQRVMRLTGLTLAVRRRGRNRRAHRGVVATPGSNQRWCSDKMTIVCWNGEIVELMFAVDCHDREAIAVIAEARAITGADVRRLMRRAAFARFGREPLPAPIQWLSDNEGIYTALETVIAAERLGLTPITTPVASPESNGIAEAFVHTLRRDYLDGADRSSAERILDQIPTWIADYNENAPHSSLGMRSPLEYRRMVQTPHAETCLTK
jgi:transposase InsO family protein